MLVMAMLPSGTTCPVGNVVWGKGLNVRNFILQPTVFVTLCWIPEIATTETLWISAASDVNSLVL